MRILWDNKFLDATLSATTENANYPLENMQDGRLNKIYKSTDDAAERIVFAGSAKASYFAILNHNFSSSATIKIEGNATDSWGSPSFSETMTWSSGVIISNFTEATYDYWSLYVDDNNSDGILEIGYCFLGTYLQMPNMRRDQSLPKNVDTNQMIGKGGQVYGNINYNFRIFGVNFNFLTNEQRQSINSMFETVADVIPVIVIPWESDTDFEDYLYCVVNQKLIDFRRTQSQNLPWSTTLNFREVF